MLPEKMDDPVIGLANSTSGFSEKRTRGILPKKLAAYDLQSLDSDVPSWQCEVCHLQVSSKESLRRHVLARHIKLPVHNCHLCTSSFVLKFQLLQHLRLSHPSEPNANSHPCICGRVFSRRNSLLCHIKRVHHPAPLQRPVCDLCSKTFNDKAAVRTHNAQVHAPASLPCPHPGCYKLFRTPGLRNAHYRYHEGRQFCCNICDKPFSTRSYRDKHQLTHSGVRQYVCGECGVAFITASQLGTHTKRRHATREPPSREGSGGQGLAANEDQGVDDPEPVEVLLGSVEDGVQFVYQHDEADLSSVHTHSLHYDNNIPNGHNSDSSHLDQNSPYPIPYSETNFSPNLFMQPESFDHPSPSGVNLDHNYFNDQSLDDIFLDDYN